MTENIKNKIASIIIPESFVCVHGISKAESVVQKIKGIFARGLFMTRDGGINSNCIAFGEYNNFDFEKVFNYVYFFDQFGISVNIIIAIPKTITASNGKQYYIGPFEDTYVGSDINRIRKVCSHPFNAWVNRKRHLLSEFILGAYIKNKDGSYTDFIINENYIGLKTLEEKTNFYDDILKEISLSCIDDDTIIIGDSFYGRNLQEYKNTSLGFKK